MLSRAWPSLPLRNVGTAGCWNGLQHPHRYREGVPGLIGTFAGLSIGSGEIFSLQGTSRPSKQVSISALAHPYRLQEPWVPPQLWGGTGAGGRGRDAMDAWHGRASTRLRPRGGGEGGILVLFFFFFSLESFKLHCHDCFYLKKKEKKKTKKNKTKTKNFCNVDLFSFVCISVCWGVSVDGGYLLSFF